jgi:hypothetical protein
VQSLRSQRPGKIWRSSTSESSPAKPEQQSKPTPEPTTATATCEVHRSQVSLIPMPHQYAPTPRLPSAKPQQTKSKVTSKPSEPPSPTTHTAQSVQSACKPEVSCQELAASIPQPILTKHPCHKPCLQEPRKQLRPRSQRRRVQPTRRQRSPIVVIQTSAWSEGRPEQRQQRSP